jgi:hypothetical protein
MLLMLQAEDMASGNPSYLTGLLPGGANTQVSGTTTAPFYSGPFPELIVREVFDTTATTPAVNGSLLNVVEASGNSLGANWIANATTSQQFGTFMYGIVWRPAISQGAQALVVTNGPCMALVYTGSTAVTYGTPLVAGGSTNVGTLTAVASPTFGTILAFSLGVLAGSTATPTLTPVWVGGC